MRNSVAAMAIATMAQLPRCVQQASWKRVWTVSRSLSTSSSYIFRPSAAFVGVPPKLLLVPDLVLQDSHLVRSGFLGLRAFRSAASSWRARGPLQFSSASVSTAAEEGNLKEGYRADSRRNSRREAILAEMEVKERELEELHRALLRVDDEEEAPSDGNGFLGANLSAPEVVAASETAESESTLAIADTSDELESDGEEFSLDKFDDEDVGDFDVDSTEMHLGDGGDASSDEIDFEDVNRAAALDVPVQASASEDAGFEDEISTVSSDSDFKPDGNSQMEELGKKHPWPQWIAFLKVLASNKFFTDEEGKIIDPNSLNSEDYGLIKKGCLNFARERDDIMKSLAQKDLEVIARFGCPSTERKIVNAGKRLRESLKVDEVSICKPCSLRPTCERADFRVASQTVAGTVEVVRLLTQYASHVSSESDSAMKIPENVQKSCTNLLQQLTDLAKKPRVGKPVEKKVEMVKSTRDKEAGAERKGKRRGDDYDTEMRFGDRKRRGGDSDIEMKAGDWKCSKCEYVNFARNRNCRECDQRRPPPDMRPGDWLCPECNFQNFSRNRECHDCKAERPPGVGFDAFKKGSRGDREGSFSARDDRRAGRDRGDRSVDRRSRFDSRGDRDDSSFDRADRFRDRGDERGAFRKSSRSESARDSFSRRSKDPEERSGRRSKHDEWKPDFSKKHDFLDDDDDDDHSGRSLAVDDDDFSLSDDDDLEDVDSLDDEEFEDMRPAASRSRGSRAASDDDDTWEDDRFNRNGRGNGRARGRGRGRGGQRGNASFGSRGGGDMIPSSDDEGFSRSSRGRVGARGRRAGGRGRR